MTQIGGLNEFALLMLISMELGTLLCFSLHTGEATVVDLSTALTAMPLAQRRKQHNRKIAPDNVYAGLQYDWHATYMIALNPSSFPNMLLQV
jgi:hypothetical protein